MRAAIERETEIKGWVRRKKIALIAWMNPYWKDLSETRVADHRDPSRSLS